MITTFSYDLCFCGNILTFVAFISFSFMYRFYVTFNKFQSCSLIMTLVVHKFRHPMVLLIVYISLIFILKSHTTFITHKLIFHTRLEGRLILGKLLINLISNQISEMFWFLIFRISDLWVKLLFCKR